MTLQFKGGDLFAMLFGGTIESVESPTAPTVSGTPTELDIELLPDVFDIIQELGKTVTFWVYPEATFDPITGTRSSGDAIQYHKKVYPPDDVNLRYVDGDLIKVGDMVTGVAAKDIEFIPSRGMRVTIDDSIWVIHHVSPIRSGEWIVLYGLYLRR